MKIYCGMCGKPLMGQAFLSLSLNTSTIAQPVPAQEWCEGHTSEEVAREKEVLFPDAPLISPDELQIFRKTFEGKSPFEVVR